MELDPRVQWFENHVVTALKVESSEWENFLSREQALWTFQLRDFVDEFIEENILCFYTKPISREVFLAPPTPDTVPPAESDPLPNLQETAGDDMKPEDISDQKAEETVAPEVPPSISATVEPTGPDPLGDLEEEIQKVEKEMPKEESLVEVAPETVCVTVLELHAKIGSIPEGVDSGCLVFVKSHKRRISIENVEKVPDLMVKKLDYLYIYTSPLNTLEGTLSQFFVPVISDNLCADDINEGHHRNPVVALPTPTIANGLLSPITPITPSLESPSAFESMMEEKVRGRRRQLPASTRNEFLANLSRFSLSASNVAAQVRGDMRQLKMPEVTIRDVESAAEDFEVVNQIEDAVENWTSIIQSVLESELERKPVGRSPLAEVEFWRDRGAVLLTLYEQLNMPAVKEVLEVLESAHSQIYSFYQQHMQELTSRTMEAKDNVKFLTTLERHFKNISTGDLTIIQDTLPSMMNALRMVWIISRHYNVDERMVPLMERIANEIGDKISVKIDVKRSLRDPEMGGVNRAFKKVVREGENVCNKWKSTYFDVREKIEMSGRDARWEFDKRKLFDRTTYMGDRCADIFQIVTVLEQFENILGPELKAVTGDPKGIDDVLRRVHNLMIPIETVPFDVFDRRFQTSWDAVMAKFHDSVREIEDLTKIFIDDSFKKLRSAEGAFELLLNFRDIETREVITKQMEQKFADILHQYSREIDQIKKLYEANMGKPPLEKNKPPVAGAITWSRSLFSRLKKTMINIQNRSDLLNSEQGKAVQKKYVTVALMIRNNENRLFEEWKDHVEKNALNHLKQCIFLVVKTTNKSPLKEVRGADKDKEKSAAAKEEREASVQPLLLNFHKDLLEIIQESKYLDRLGFKIPETAMNITLQEDKYRAYMSSLQGILDDYHCVLDGVGMAERQLLGPKMKTLSTVMKPALVRINWNSLSINDFIQNASRAIEEFLAHISQIQKNTSIIKNVVDSIAGAQLVRDPPNNEPMDLSEFFDFMEKHRNRVLDDVIRKYHTISPILIKIEEHVFGEGTGRCARMKDYYFHWEKRIFKAINAMILSGLIRLAAILHMPISKKILIDRRKNPVIKATATLAAPEIVVSPSFGDIHKTLSKLAKDIVESSMRFVRWQHKSCVPVPPQFNADDEEPIIFSYYSDISKQQPLMKVMFLINQSIQKVFSNINKHLESYRRYHTLWSLEKGTTLEKFASKSPSVVEFDVKLGGYARLRNDVQIHRQERHIDFLRVSTRPLVEAIRAEASSWMHLIGQHLIKSAERAKEEILEKIVGYRDEMGQTPQTLEELKHLLGVITEVFSVSVDMEMDISDVVERYRTLSIWGVPVEDRARDAINELPVEWESLVQLARSTDVSLDMTKKMFTKVTEKDVSAFVLGTVKLQEEFEKRGPCSGATDMEMGLEALAEFRLLLEEEGKRRDELLLAEKLFGLPITSYPELQQMERELARISTVYELYNEIQASIHQWSSGLWADLDMSTLESGLDGFVHRQKKLDKELRNTVPYQIVSERLENFKSTLPLLHDLKNPALRKRHWNMLMKATGKVFEIDPKKFTMQSVFEMELHQVADVIAEITSGAMKELQIEKGLDSMNDVWRTQKLDLTKYMKGIEDRGWILKSTDEIMLTVEDQTMNLQSMSSSRFVATFKEFVNKWEKNLSAISEVLDEWLRVQQKWMYLESIFVGSDDIRMQLPEEAKRFDKIDKTFKKLMVDTAKNPNVLECCSFNGRLEMLKNLTHQLELCQKSLTNYLLTKRNAFPRFFFISDDELLSILGNSDPNGVQEHMLKMFDNSAELLFGKGRLKSHITAMKSSEGEQFSFHHPILPEGNVETWMLETQKMMNTSLRLILKAAVFYYPEMARMEWFKKYQGMIAVTGSQIWWTWEVEDAFRKVKSGDKHAMKKLLIKLTAQLTELVNEVRLPLSSNERKKLNAGIIIEVHARDIVDRFVRDSIMDSREFAWESQLRFYWDKEVDDARVKQTTGNFGYGYEYMGLNGRLVITPLTDRCYMTLTQALSFRLGGSPAGPAGTGKTETVKDLAKAMALFCVVFNCGEGLDYKAMGSIFSGLVQTGSWGCFDEFNRIDAEVLSVVSAQIKTIQNAMLQKLKKFQFEGHEIPVDDKMGIFITMNPGYAGRTELPDNLKALFRPVVMVVPDLLLICEIMLFSEGFVTARLLAKKMTVLYRLAKEQLSKQYHYDFGLRALKSVLVMAGSLKRGSPDLSEDVVLMRALRDMNLPKFIYEDVPLFRGLITDLFPGLDCPRVRYPSLNDAVEEESEKHGYTKVDIQIDKVIQLYETMLTRHTTMVVGPTMAGKTVVIETLARAQTKLGLNTRLYVLNPKSQTVSELYGVLDPITRDWTDGLYSNIFRDINKPSEKSEKRYVVFDGDVDAVWVENMNSVMDDNKLLTLPNGERIRLQNHCAILFEVFDLQYASPATISRCGMVYLDPRDLGYEPYISKWLRERIVPDVDILTDLFPKYVTKAVNYVFLGEIDGNIVSLPKLTIPTNNLSAVRQLCRMLEALLPEAKQVSNRLVIESAFVFAVVWSIGSLILEESRGTFDNLVRRCCGWNQHSGASTVAGSLPGVESTLYEYVFDVDNAEWCSWKSLVQPYVPPLDGKFSKILVPTVDTVRSTWILETMTQALCPVLFVGESGTAKTVVIQNFLRDLDTEKSTVLSIAFSSRTNSMDVQRNLEENVDKRTKDTYGPLAGKKLLVFIDDLNMPKVDIYGTQQPIALLKLLIDKGNIFDRGKDLNAKYLRDVYFISAMAPPGGARNPVDPRFVSLFCVFNITIPSQESLQLIFNSILKAHMSGNFGEEMLAVVEQITRMTLGLYESIQIHLPPTPSKFHYVFTLRDLSRIYEGLLMSTPDAMPSMLSFMRLWRNECLRVFHDRLTNVADKEFVIEKLNHMMKKEFPEDADMICADPLVFGDFGEVLEAEDPRIYQDLRSYDRIRHILDEVLENYNEKHTQMNLVLFDDALEHLTRLHRIIRIPRGNALLVGVGGSGKQSLTALATYLAGYTLFSITLSRGYSEADFREELKQMYMMLGVENKEVVFLFTDAHVVEENFLELINNMLTSGMVPALFAEEDKENLIASIRDEVVKAGVPETKENCWNFFVSKCRDNLHIVLAMSPVGSTLRIRSRNFPGMVNNTVIDWFTAWPLAALEAVATRFLAEEDIPPENKEQIVLHMVGVHRSVMQAADDFLVQLRRYVYVTPKNYLDYIENYRSLLKSMRKSIGEQSNRFGGGLDKLVQAAEEVKTMNENLVVQKKLVDEKTKACADLLDVISANTAEAEEKQIFASKKEAELQVFNIKISKEKGEAEDELAQALPALEAAQKALEGLSKNDITEIRTFAKPPAMVQTVCECVCILRNVKDVSWKGAKAMMASATFLQELLEFDKDSLNDKSVKLVRESMKKSGSTAEAMKSVSQAGLGLLEWVDAMVHYYFVAKSVNPKRNAVAQAEKNLRISEKDLARIKSDLQTLSAELKTLGDQYSEATAEQKDLSEKAEIMARRLAAAQQLIAGLSTEKERWGVAIRDLENQKMRLVGDGLLCSAFLSYCGPFNYQFRNQLIYTDWMNDAMERKIPMSKDFRLETILTDEVQISQWTAEGLPADELSLQNGILTTKASRWPLCVDPQTQAVKWIKEKEANNSLKITTFNEPDFLKQLELAIQYGFPILFEGIDETIDPVINVVLEKNVIQAGNRKYITLGDKDIDWDDSFRLYFTTKLANPHYSPEISGKTMIINYTVTQSGLQDQLLNVVVGYERPDLEEQRETLIQEMSENKSMLKNLEDTLLRELATSTGLILDNEDLISTLERTKKAAREIANKLDMAKKTAGEIDKLRSGYSAAAERGSVLFFCLQDLPSISEMYEISLSSYLEVFNTSLRKAERHPHLNNRLRNIISTLTYDVYKYVCTGIFEKHKLMFSFQMTIRIMDCAGEVNHSLLDFFVKGNIGLDKSPRVKPNSWISEAGWEDMLKLTTLDDKFSALADDLEFNQKEWKTWYDYETPETMEMPMGYSEKLDDFEKLCLLRCYRTDRVYVAVTHFVEAKMGEKYTQPPVLNYHTIFEQSSNTSPVVFILSPGADPLQDLQALAESVGMGANKFRFLSLGQGQGGVAQSLLEMGATRGQWIVLQNCHLLASWLKTLEKIIEKTHSAHKDYRLFLTTDPTPNFPLGILQRSFKVVTEPPSGLKLNLRSTFARLSEVALAQCSHDAFRPLVYVLAFFHAVVQERRKYGKIGWNVAYDFNESDFRVSMLLMNTYLTKALENGDVAIPWGSLRYLIGEAMYGGRVTDDWDRRVISNYMDEYLGDFIFDTFQPFHFFHNEDVDYKIPALGSVDHYRRAIEQLPTLNSPEVFGLHANAEIDYLSTSSRNLWRDLIDLQPRTAATAGGASRESFIATVATDILEKLPEMYDLPLIQREIGDEVSPTAVVLLQELERFNRLIFKMAFSLKELKKALIGEIGMNAELENLGTSLANGQLPAIWIRLVPATQKPLGGWLGHFHRRDAQYRLWVSGNEPTVMWLSGLHIPESYFTALVQTTCRVKQWPLDKSTLYTEVTQYTSDEQISKKPDHGCFVKGLFLEGAGWDLEACQLVRQKPKILVTEMPIIRVIPIESSKLKVLGTFETPVYVTQDRRNAMGVGYVFSANLKSSEHESHWVLQGVALSLNVT